MNIDRIKITELVISIQSGDVSAFDELYKETSQAAYFTALKITKNPEDAEDILQDSFVTVLEQIDTLKEPGSFMSWFNQIVANRAKNSLVKMKPELFKTEEDEQSAFEFIPDENLEFQPEARINQNELRDRMMEIIDGLSDKYRAAVILYYYDDMSIAEIARAIDISENLVKARLFNARKEIKKGVEALEKKNIKLRGISLVAIPAAIWALKGSASAATAAFVTSGAAAATFTAVTAAAKVGSAASVGAGAAGAAGASGTAAAATAGAATAGAAGAGGTAAAATAGGIAAKAAALTVTQKVVAGIVAAGIAAGTATGSAKVIKKAVADRETSIVSTTVVTTTEEMIFAVESKTSETKAQAVSKASEKAENTTTAKPLTQTSASSAASTQSVTTASEKQSETTKAKTTVRYTKASTSKATTSTSKPLTTAVKTTADKTTATTTTRHTTTTKINIATTSTTKATTAEPTTQTTTESTTKGKATVSVSCSTDGNDSGQVSYTVNEGDPITYSAVVAAVKSDVLSKYGNKTTDPEVHISSGDEVSAAEARTYSYNCVVYL